MFRLCRKKGKAYAITITCCTTLFADMAMQRIWKKITSLTWKNALFPVLIVVWFKHAIRIGVRADSRRCETDLLILILKDRFFVSSLL